MDILKRVLLSEISFLVMFIASLSPVYAASEDEIEILGFSLPAAQVLFSQVEDTIIYSDRLTSDEKVSIVLSYYNQVPEGIIDFLSEYDIKIYLSGAVRFLDEDEATSVKALSSTAVLSYYKKSGRIISINENPYTIISTISSDNLDTIVHEIGHLLDNAAMLSSGYFNSTQYIYSTSNEWISLYDVYKYQLASIDSMSVTNVLLSEQEGFCEAFRLAVLSPEELEEKTPEIYAYICEVIEEYSDREGS